ncbi:signal peptidase II [uncultured Cohaesibacter sp.]|uniref:signal peptidase II n=1 Tax=uncultured Cohaesibacter sp. TaxID=1002546 RepID=UPI002931897A|nr:signal peptidase II [uncultured Cohaesibacter sp.]
MSYRTTGYLAAFIGLALDQAVKLWMLWIYQIEEVMRLHGPVALAPFFDLVLVWNRGISYGWLQQDDEIGRIFLIGLAFVASIVLAIWIWRTRDRLTALALGLIMGGAIGNGIDRILHGAVVDLFHFHWRAFSWYVFNIADLFIVLGALLLVYESFFGTSGNGNRPEDGDSSRKDAAKG